ncbi:DMT family transporter [Sulfurospirillum sp. 1612]|uniref:DMT family transporter n=1 Tax=Sulfurospirillum sp. 1612 TaxID=3094835 RepID=UPI002F938E06
MRFLPVIAFFALGIIWGSNFIYMKLAAHLISPMQVVFFRILFGFIPVLLYAYYSKVLSLSHLKHFRHFIIMALLAAVIYYFGFVKGSFLLPSGVAGVLSGAIPLFSFLLSIIFLKDEKTDKFGFLGLLLGFLGVVTISGIFTWHVESLSIKGIVYMLSGSLSVGASFVYAKKYIMPLRIPVVALTTYQLGFALLILLFITDFDGINRVWSDANTAVGLVLGLGLLGTGLAYIIYYYLIEKFGSIKAASVTYLPPVVALFIGVVIVGEDINWVDYISAGLIFLGVYFINRKKSR